MVAVLAALALHVVAHVILHAMVPQHLQDALAAHHLVLQVAVVAVPADAQAHVVAVVVAVVAEVAVVVVPVVVPGLVEVVVAVLVAPLALASVKVVAGQVVQESVVAHHVVAFVLMFATEVSVTAVAKALANLHVRGPVFIHVTSHANIEANNFYGRNQTRIPKLAI